MSERCYACGRLLTPDEGHAIDVRTGSYSGAFGHGEYYRRAYICDECYELRRVHAMWFWVVLFFVLLACVLSRCGAAVAGYG